MSASTFWQAVSAYHGKDELEAWEGLIKYLDSRADYSLAIFQVDLETFTDNLIRRVETQSPGSVGVDRLSDLAHDIVLAGLEAYNEVMSAPEVIERFPVKPMIDDWSERLADYWENG